MSDAALCDLAAQAGILVDWTDAAGEPKTVAPETLRQMLTALGLPCRTAGDLTESRRRLARQAADLPGLIVADAGKPVPLARSERGIAKLELENGKTRDLEPRARGGRWELPPIAEAGYHRLAIDRRQTMIAVAPPRCFAVNDISRRPIWGLAAQIYGLRHDGDGGIGDFGGVVELARAAAPFGCDTLALSPIHALFGAHPERFAPYSPSSRSFLNPLHADPALVFGAEYIKEAIATAGGRGGAGGALIDWPARAGEKHALFRALFAAMARSSALTTDLVRYREAKGDALKRHAQFEAREAPRAHRAREIGYHIFLQWLAERSLAAAQSAARAAGMRIGLIADLAVGTDPGGSDAWSRRDEMLTGFAIGAPPDLFNPRGQNWGLTAFSPRAFVASGYAPFLDMLRAGMRHAGGIRIDHAMGLRRLWLVPEGASPAAGAYLNYPLEDLLRLIALESTRHRAIVIAEDLGTVPPGFSDRLNQAGILGMRILWFERDGARFLPPEKWRRAATAMTSTHDLPTVAGWWRGADIATKAKLGLFDKPRGAAAARQERQRDRAELWRALKAGGSVRGKKPSPRESNPVVDGALRFVARTPSRLALIPLEDLVGEPAQPNLPGTIDEHPNWRRRQKAGATKLLGAPKVAARLRALHQERDR
jgi:4-alpha-glucanotransferase